MSYPPGEVPRYETDTIGPIAEKILAFGRRSIRSTSMSPRPDMCVFRFALGDNGDHLAKRLRNAGGWYLLLVAQCNLSRLFQNLLLVFGLKTDPAENNL